MSELIGSVTDLDGDVLPVNVAEEAADVGGYPLDLDGIGQLQVLLDQAVRSIRDYQAGR